VLTPACRSLSHRFGFVARPRADRWGRRPTALFGGLAICGTVFAVAAATGTWQHLWQLLAAGALIAGFGLADDVLSVKPATKLIAQISVASLLLFFGYRLH
jgi:UDP-GlcNAc:undecaprenyl-phosphate GlcNAc-1-phosphate transferase